MKKSNLSASDPSLIVSLHRVGQSWRVVVGRTMGNRVGFVESKTFPADQVARISTWLAEKLISRFVVILPSGSVICRTCPLPNGGAEQLNAALRLQAEAHLLGGIPPHRVALAVLPVAAGESSRSGLILAWPNSSTVAIPSGIIDATYVPEVACLAALLNGFRPAEPLIWVNRDDGSLATAITHAQGAVFRSTREAIQDSSDWRQSVGRVLAETALNVGHTPEFTEALVQATSARFENVEQATLLLPREILHSLPGRFGDSPTDEAWWQTYGVAAGAVMASAGELASLTVLRPEPAVEKPTVVGSVVSSLSVPRVAAYAAIAALLLFTFGPVAFAGLRLLVLKMKVGDEALVQADINRTQNSLIMYAELEKQAWPMLKVFSDVCCAMPEGVEIDSINIVHGEPVVIRGVAKPVKTDRATDIILKMEGHLRQSGLFTGVTKGWDSMDGMGAVKFNMTAQVAKPWEIVKYPEELDFAALTLADRKYGRKTPPPTASKTPDRTSPAEAASPASSPNTAPAEGLSPTDLNGSESPVVSASDQPTRIVTSTPAEGTNGSDPEISPVSPELREPMTSAPATPEIVDPAARQPQDEQPSTPERSQPVKVDPRNLPRHSSGGSGDVARHDKPSNDSTPRNKVPQPLTPEQIKQMSRPETLEAVSKVATARGLSGLDEETQSRLKEEFLLLQAHLKEAK